MLIMQLAVQLLPDTVPGGLATLSLAVTLGLALGAIRVRGVKLGVSGVLFSSLIFGQLGLTVEPKVLDFLGDFALIIFVYAIGLQVGPGFLTSLRHEGLRLNLLSICVIGLGALLTLGIVKLAKLPIDSTSGLYAGAFTTTPGLAAGQEALKQARRGLEPAAISHAVALAGLAYTVTYPFGILGPILVIEALRRIFGVRVDQERANLAAAERVRRPPIETIDFEVTESVNVGTALKDHPLLRDNEIILTRLLRGSTVVVPTGETQIQLGDVYRAAGQRNVLGQLVRAMGKPAMVDFERAGGDVGRMELVVTRTQVLRKSLRELNVSRRTGVSVTRVIRSGIELSPKATLRLQFGDNVIAVGPRAGLAIVEKELGNSPDRLNRPQLVPIFLGIVLGVAVGTMPLAVPGLHTTLRLGLAGGPMLAAIALSQFGNIGSVVWYMPTAANQLFRDFGLAVFLACVGLRAGNHFLQQLTQSGGVMMVLWGACITVLPVLLIGILARVLLKMNFVTLSGWVSGAMTSSPALLFAGELAQSDQPALAYAAVAPLGMLVPILCAQLLVVFLG